MDNLTPIIDPSPERRRASISRLRGLTAGVAVAGLAGTAGLGVLAANGYTGASTTTNATLPDASTAPVPQLGGDDQVPSYDGGQGTSPNNTFRGFNGQGQVGTTVVPPAIGFGPGHVSTGGS